MEAFLSVLLGLLVAVLVPLYWGHPGAHYLLPIGVAIAVYNPAMTEFYMSFDNELGGMLLQAGIFGVTLYAVNELNLYLATVVEGKKVADGLIEPTDYIAEAATKFVADAGMDIYKAGKSAVDRVKNALKPKMVGPGGEQNMLGPGGEQNSPGALQPKVEPSMMSYGRKY